jgi:hypothetical protein
MAKFELCVNLEAGIYRVSTKQLHKSRLKKNTSRKAAKAQRLPFISLRLGVFA